MKPFYHPSSNPYFEKIAELNDQRCVQSEETERHRSQWRATLGVEPEKKLILEIGCNGGHFLNAAAIKNPNQHFIGLDYKFKQIYLAYQKAKTRQIKNCSYLRANAHRIEHIFGKNELNEIWVYFPDPWEKKGQNKHRLLTEAFFMKAHSLLASGGILDIKTDHKGYFEFVLDEFENFRLKTSSFKILEKNFDLYANVEGAKKLELGEVTLFERLFIKDGLPIHRLRIQKPL